MAITSYKTLRRLKQAAPIVRVTWKKGKPFLSLRRNDCGNIPQNLVLSWYPLSGLVFYTQKAWDRMSDELFGLYNTPKISRSRKLDLTRLVRMLADVRRDVEITNNALPLSAEFFSMHCNGKRIKEVKFKARPHKGEWILWKTSE